MNPFPLVRYYARKALEQVRGQACAVDLNATTAEIAAAARRCAPEAFPDALLLEEAPHPARHTEPDED